MSNKAIIAADFFLRNPAFQEFLSLVKLGIIEIPQEQYPQPLEYSTNAVEERAEVERLLDELDDYQGRLWCALGQPLNIDLITAVKQMRAELLEDRAMDADAKVTKLLEAFLARRARTETT